MSDAREVRVVDDGGAGDREFVPGARDPRRQWVYDLRAWVMGAGKHLDRLVELAGIQPVQTVLDVGCGTGNLALRVAAAGGVVTGLDPDRAALDRAARKARRRNVGMTLVRGYADRLPVDDASADHVVSSLALHHVPADQRAAAAAEIARVLRPGGVVTILDLAHHGGHDHGGHDHSSPDHDHHHDGRFARRGQKLAAQADAADGGIEHLMAQAGLTGVTVVESHTIKGTRVDYLQAHAPA